eukprot:CAMPEP_0182439350 /NCGR_PEP_ID=MMETSP1167-20130531/86382_1 /TAXON_ID=2988 /ORGANISM="Mallomonas Sp, Strain CCMP3275" /LENGTH=150 /DNA_ID=CAMNT_0024633027 /DNA_START=1050 /DNA_END=1502 /DNA_ORIENTATION=-
MPSIKARSAKKIYVAPHRKSDYREVLVVDDAAMNRKMMIRLLTGHCDGVSTAIDGVDGVAKMRHSLEEKRPYSLVLMDYQMPNMDGPTATKEMREMGFRGPILGVTGNTLPVQVTTFLSSGADKVLHKPLEFEQLMMVLKEMGKKDILTP